MRNHRTGTHYCFVVVQHSICVIYLWQFDAIVFETISQLFMKFLEVKYFDFGTSIQFLWRISFSFRAENENLKVQVFFSNLVKCYAIENGLWPIRVSHDMHTYALFTRFSINKRETCFFFFCTIVIQYYNAARLRHN